MIDDPVRETTATLTSADGTPLFCRAWSAPGPDSGDVVVVVPGIGLHSGPYRVVADALTPRGHGVVAVDLRGHGRSGGPHGRVPGSAEIRDDLDAVMGWVLAKGARRVHLLGESMGGLVALDYAAGGAERLRSLLLVAPAIRLACAQVVRSESWGLVRWLLAPRRPLIDLAGSRLDEATTDQEFKRARRADPLADNAVSAEYLLGLARLRAGWRAKARRIIVPTQVLHGCQDAIVDWRGARALHAALAATVRELVLVDGAHHTLFWDPAAPEVFAHLRRWLAARAV